MRRRGHGLCRKFAGFRPASNSMGSWAVIQCSTLSLWRSSHSDARAEHLSAILEANSTSSKSGPFQSVQPGLHGLQFFCWTSLTSDLAVLLLLRVQFSVAVVAGTVAPSVGVVACTLCVAAASGDCIFSFLQKHSCFVDDLFIEEVSDLQQICSAQARRFVAEVSWELFGPLFVHATLSVTLLLFISLVRH